MARLAGGVAGQGTSPDESGAAAFITPIGDFVDSFDPLHGQRSSQAPCSKSSLDFYVPLWVGEASSLVRPPARELALPPREGGEVRERPRVAPLAAGYLDGGVEVEVGEGAEEKARSNLEQKELEQLKEELVNACHKTSVSQNVSQKEELVNACHKTLPSEELGKYYRQLVDYVLEEPAAQDCFHGQSLPVGACARVRACVQHRERDRYEGRLAPPQNALANPGGVTNPLAGLPTHTQQACVGV